MNISFPFMGCGYLPSMFSSISISQFVLGSISKNRLTGPFSAHKIYILIPWLMSKDSFFFISPLLTFTESRMAYSFAPIYPLAYIHCSVWDSSVDSLMVIFTFLSVAQISNGSQISIRNKVCLMAVYVILSVVPKHSAAPLPLSLLQ